MMARVGRGFAMSSRLEGLELEWYMDEHHLLYGEIQLAKPHDLIDNT